jgi:hypothetical protein
MSASDFPEGKTTQARPNAWHAMHMTVLVFRETAQQQDKGNQACDGATLANPANSGNVAKAAAGSINVLGGEKKGPNTEKTFDGCPADNFS